MLLIRHKSCSHQRLLLEKHVSLESRLVESPPGVGTDVKLLSGQVAGEAGVRMVQVDVQGAGRLQLQIAIKQFFSHSVNGSLLTLEKLNSISSGVLSSTAYICTFPNFIFSFPLLMVLRMILVTSLGAPLNVMVT